MADNHNQRPYRSNDPSGRGGAPKSAVAPGEGDVRMLGKPLLTQVLDDEALTRGLGDAEARVLVEWLVEQAEDLSANRRATEAQAEMSRLCRRGRAIARFVSLWCLQRLRGAAIQLAGTERFSWQLPDDHRIDGCLWESVPAAAYRHFD